PVFFFSHPPATSHIHTLSLHDALPISESKQLTLEADLDPSVGVVRADPDRFRQIIWNLLSNAVKFTPPQGRVQVSLKRLGVEVRSEEHTSELQSRGHLVCRLLLEKKKK